MSLRKITFVALTVLCAGLVWIACRPEPPIPQRVGIKAAVPVPPESPAFEEDAEAPQRARTIERVIGPAQRLAANSAQSGMDMLADDEDDESKYWAGVEFGPEQFDEVLEFVAQEYIEEKTDAARAYVSAVNFALSSLDPAQELIPKPYYEAHKDDPGIELAGDDRDELTLKRREIFRKRHDGLQAEWGKVKFGRKEFESVMAFAEKQGGKSKKKVTRSRVWLAAAQGYLYALDPHSSLLSTKAWEESTQETHDASFDGIGALLTQRFEPSKTLGNRLDGKTRKPKGAAGCLLIELKEEDKLRRRTFVESPMPGQPAEKAGVWAGDEIVKVDGTSVVDVPLDKVVSMIRGKRDTPVKLTLLREGVPGETVVSVIRAHIRVTNVEGRILENHPCVGYVKLTGFIETSYDDLTARIAELESKCSDGEGLRGLVFDMRNNSGGLLSQGIKISDLFVPKGTIVTVKNRRKSVFEFMIGPEEHEAHEKNTLTLPLVVLVNDGAASASEIVASALQDNGRGLIVGERTFGKASVQTLITPLRGKGYYIKLTIARYYSPSGRTLQVVGVTPDVTAAPGVDGKMPVGFREEDLSNHLPQLDTDYESTNKQLTARLKSCVEKRGIAEKIFKDNPHPQIKFDYQLYLGADYLECLIEHGREEEVDIVDHALESP